MGSNMLLPVPWRVILKGTCWKPNGHFFELTSLHTCLGGGVWNVKTYELNLLATSGNKKLAHHSKIT